MSCEMIIKVKVALWLKVYLWVMMGYYQTTRRQPDWDKLERIIKKGITAYLTPPSN